MKEAFRGYYRPSDNEFSELWNNCIFSFDANILLNIYRYSPETRERFMQILNDVSDRIIISHQAAKEYQKNRLTVIKEQETAYDKIIDDLDDNFTKIKDNLNPYQKHPLINIKEIVNSLDNVYKTLESDLLENKKNHPNLFYKDDLRDELTNLLNNKIGNPFNADKIKEIKENGKHRYIKKMPPGYLDYKKEENQYGDLILWFQLIDIAKEKELPIIFVTDEKKADWWWKSGEKTIGPRPELIEEFYKEANVQFYMYRTDRFIKFAEKQFFPGKDADPEFIKEVKYVMRKDKDLRDSNSFYPKKLRFSKSDMEILSKSDHLN